LDFPVLFSSYTKFSRTFEGNIMEKEISSILTEHSPKAIGPYSQAVAAGSYNGLGHKLGFYAPNFFV
jgi:hypothetical protein